MSEFDVSVVGLGRLGACYAAVLANNGVHVLGADIDDMTVAAINEGRAPASEPDLQAYLDAAGDRLVATTDTAQAVQETELTFLFVDSPSREGDPYSTENLVAAGRSVGTALREDNSQHTVVVRTTVLPGRIRGAVRESIEAGLDDSFSTFRLCFLPEFTAAGTAIAGMEQPDFFLVGTDSPAAGDEVETLCRTVRRNDAPIVRTSVETAEVAKLANNSYRTLKIAFANLVGRIAEGTGADADRIVETFAHDSHINERYLRPGASYGGPCYPHDNAALSRVAREAGTEGVLARASEESNRQHANWVAACVRERTDPGEPVAILGLTYKPGVGIVESSLGLSLARALHDYHPLRCHDPCGIERAAEVLDVPVEYFPEASAALNGAATAVLAVRWPSLCKPALYDSRSLSLLDPWGEFVNEPLDESVDYHPLGRLQ